MDKLLEALKGIEKCCDGNNDSHRQIWGIAYSTIKEYESNNKLFTEVGVSWPTKEDITSELKECDKNLKLSENLNEKQAFNHGFRVCYRWLKNRL